jgi:hypothetical protein
LPLRVEQRRADPFFEIGHSGMAPNRELATGNWQLATGNWKLEAGSWQLAT